MKKGMNVALGRAHGLWNVFVSVRTSTGEIGSQIVVVGGAFRKTRPTLSPPGAPSSVEEHRQSTVLTNNIP